jgi:hypothetical protein
LGCRSIEKKLYVGLLSCDVSYFVAIIFRYREILTKVMFVVMIVDNSALSDSTSSPDTEFADHTYVFENGTGNDYKTSAEKT